MAQLLSLPVDAVLARIKKELARGARQIIVRASPGTGKTTRIPPALLDVFLGQIWVLEPRRLAAKMAALRVCDETESPPGQLVGWQMRFDSMLSQQTRVLFLTEGMFPVRLSQSPNLQDVSCVILDEFHERHAQTDIAFALTRHLQDTTRPDLCLIVMSATLDVSQLKQAMPDAVVIDIEAPVYPVQTRWWRGDTQRPLPEKMCDGVLQLAKDPSHTGHILAFLPGTFDIMRSAALLRRSLQTDPAWEVLELRASLGRREQERVFTDIGKRKIILATNIAESSLTIPGVTAVVDSGLARIPTFQPNSTLTTLETRRVCQASVVQRAGRAGRTAPGIALRLFSEHDYAGRPGIDVPELLRSDLSPILLAMMALKHKTAAEWSPETLPWLDTPTRSAWQTAGQFLRMLDITDDEQNLKRPHLGSWPVHPRIARFLDECMAHKLAAEGAVLATILSEDSLLKQHQPGAEALGCDLLAHYEAVTRQHGQSSQDLATFKQNAQRLRSIIGCKDQPLKAAHELDLVGPLMAAYPDRIAKARTPFSTSPTRAYTICTGGDVSLATTSAAAHQDWIVALTIDSSRVVGSNLPHLKDGAINIGLATGINKDDLVAAPAPWLSEQTNVVWDDDQERVRSVEQTTYGILTVEERRTSVQPDQAAPLLLQKLRERWPRPFADEQALTFFVTRQKLLREHGLSNHAWDLNELRELLLAHMIDGATSFADVKARSLEEWLRSCIGEQEWRDVERLAPSQIKVGAGFYVPVHYDSDIPPWIGARLQNFFGQMETPRILEGRVLLTVHLWAPNQRALQVTTDLASFWRTAYPALRNEFMRKYPRHYWPENPAEAEPPVRGSLKPRP